MNFTFSDAAKNTFKDRWGNDTVYNYPDQATLLPSTSSYTTHTVFRSVEDYVSYQSMNANAHVKVGPWFSASVDTKKAASTMSDSLHIVAESTKEIGIYGIQLDPGLLLQPTSKFALYVSQLPEQYDNDTYSQFVSDWGTHYISSATFGGRATLATTTISHEYFSSTGSDVVHAGDDSRAGAGHDAPRQRPSSRQLYWKTSLVFGITTPASVTHRRCANPHNVRMESLWHKVTDMSRLTFTGLPDWILFGAADRASQPPLTGVRLLRNVDGDKCRLTIL